MALAIYDSTPPTAVPPRRLAHRPAGRARTGRCRATRGRQCLAGLVVVSLGTGCFLAVTEAVAAVGRHVIEAPVRSPPAEGDWVVRAVAPGESLWSIAASFPGGGDVRAQVDELVRLNGGVTVDAGQAIRIPAAWADGAS